MMSADCFAINVVTEPGADTGSDHLIDEGMPDERVDPAVQFPRFVRVLVRAQVVRSTAGIVRGRDARFGEQFCHQLDALATVGPGGLASRNLRQGRR